MTASTNFRTHFGVTETSATTESCSARQHTTADAPFSRAGYQRFTRLHDYLRHLGVRPLEAGHGAVWHQQLELLVVERASRRTRSNTAKT